MLASLAEKDGVNLFPHSRHILYICGMIQRRQSIYLFLAALFAALLLILNLTFFKTVGSMDNGDRAKVEVGYFTSTFIGEDATEPEKPLGNNSALIGGIAAYAGLTFLSIFMFKNRKRQSLMVTLAFAFLIYSLVMMYSFSFDKDYLDVVKVEELLWPALIPVSLLILQFLALRGIKQDEALVRSLDRIR